MIKGLILAAGIGSRLKPWTDHHPKSLVDVGGKPMLQRVIENMAAAGIHDIIINIHHKGDQIVDFITANQGFGQHIQISDERNLLLDTGGAITQATRFIAPDDTLLVHNADIFTDISLKSLIIKHIELNSDALLLTSQRNSSRQLLVDNANRLMGWINHKTGEILPPALHNGGKSLTYRSFNGIHLLGPDILQKFGSMPYSTPYPLVPQYISLCQSYDIKTYTPEHDYTWIDVGKPDTLSSARAIAHTTHPCD